ncbi:rhodanese-like domain-containing protein [Vagococcus sp.]|uniref:rhodanese-like domain-containing protein n=1 Tax=Vagococcus sp. TaxID=1933889 RepID=UPI003F9A75B3
MLGFFKSVPSISTQELQQKMASQPVILDVRTQSEFQTGHLFQAKHLSANQLANYQAKKEAPVYVICQSGMRSKRAVKTLRARGIEAINVRGGMNQWTGTIKRGK